VNNYSYPRVFGRKSYGCLVGEKAKKLRVFGRTILYLIPDIVNPVSKKKTMPYVKGLGHTYVLFFQH
jgi:hypothetical protein